ncbi:group III truncated hemoglobin [Sphingopyxis sp. KK2]|uniref:group III truncated hemoglobin n=1 Tax=Sphingopyxis sp. KK2 TaxID=1855727 RepID=UPI00097E5922|nr:group III truncated hemoglobin [Sphingopyxis sp. KK2]
MTQDCQIDEAALERLVPAFYARVRADTLLGPLFDDAVHDWPDHLERLVAFWSSVMLTSGRYKGSPMAAHLRHRAAITPTMFDRWLAIWADTTDAMMPPAAAAALQAKAARIAESLQLALFFRLGDPGRRAA